MKFNIKKQIDNRKIFKIFGTIILAIIFLFVLNNVINVIRRNSIEKSADIRIMIYDKNKPIYNKAPSISHGYYYIIDIDRNELYKIEWSSFKKISTYKIYNKIIAQQEINQLLENIENKKNGTLKEKTYKSFDPGRFIEYRIEYNGEQVTLQELPFSY